MKKNGKTSTSTSKAKNTGTQTNHFNNIPPSSNPHKEKTLRDDKELFMDIEAYNMKVKNNADKTISPEELLRKHGIFASSKEEEVKSGSQYEYKGGANEDEDLEQEEMSRQEALDKLLEFDLSELRITNDFGFDQRKKTTKQYLALCVNAGLDPIEHYNRNKHADAKEVKQIASTRSQGSLDQSQPILKEDSPKLASKPKIEEVPVRETRQSEPVPSGIVLKNDGTLDMRHKVNKEFIQREIENAKRELHALEHQKKVNQKLKDELLEKTNEEYYKTKKYE